MRECPNCHLIASFEKVCDLYRKGLRRVSYEKPVDYYWCHKVVHLGTEIATCTEPSPLTQRFCPPPRPCYYGMFLSSEEEAWFSTFRVIVSIGIVSLIWIAISETIQTIIKSSVIITSAAIYNVIMGALFLIFLAVVCLQLIKDIRNVILVRKKAAPLWKEDYDIWKELYYCAKCDSIFQSTTSKCQLLEK